MRSCQHLAQPPSWRTTPCRLFATAHSIYSQPPSIVEAVSPSATWRRAMLCWQGPAYHGHIPSKVGYAHVKRAFRCHFPVSVTQWVRFVTKCWGLWTVQAASRSAHPKAAHLSRSRSSISVLTRTKEVFWTCKHKHHSNAVSSATESLQWSLHFRFSAQNYTVDSSFVCSIRAICVAQHIVPDLLTPISCELLIQEGTYWRGGGTVTLCRTRTVQYINTAT